MKNTASLKSAKSYANAGIGDNARRDISQHLSKMLASTYGLFLNTQGVHWNVTGPLFKSIHDLTEIQYTEMFAAIDEIAERIRALGHTVSTGLDEFQEMGSPVSIPANTKAEAMVKSLADQNATLAKFIRDVAEHAAEKGDKATEDLCNRRLHAHEKNAWMLGATLS